MKTIFLRASFALVVCWGAGLVSFGQSSQSRTDSAADRERPAGQASDTAFLKRAMEANSSEVELGKLAQSKSQNKRVQDFGAMMVRDHTDALNRFRQASTGGGSSQASGTDTRKQRAAGTSSGETSDTSSNTNSTRTGGGGTNAENKSGEVQLSREHQQLRDRLSKLSGADFDREYMAAMVQEHQKAVREFEKESGQTPTSSSSPESKGGRDTASGSTSGAGKESAVKSRARELLPVLKMHLNEAQTIQRELQRR